MEKDTPLNELGFTEVIQLPKTFETECERRWRINDFIGYLGRTALLDYVPEPCLNYHMTLPGRRVISKEETAIELYVDNEELQRNLDMSG